MQSVGQGVQRYSGSSFGVDEWFLIRKAAGEIYDCSSL